MILFYGLISIDLIRYRHCSGLYGGIVPQVHVQPYPSPNDPQPAAAAAAVHGTEIIGWRDFFSFRERHSTNFCEICGPI